MIEYGKQIIGFAGTGSIKMTLQGDTRRDKIQRLRQCLANVEKQVGLDTGLGCPENKAANQSPGSPWQIDIPGVDAVLPQCGLRRAGVHEVYGASHSDTAAASGYLLALLRILCQSRCAVGTKVQSSVLFCQPAEMLHEFGAIYGNGLRAFGFDPGDFIFAQTANNTETLWALEKGARSGCLLAVAGEVSGLSFTESRRLSLASAATGTPVLLLRSHKNLAATAALTRWCICAHPGGGAPFNPAAPHFPRWQVELQRCRGGRAGQWNLEWDHETHCFRLAEDISARLPAQADAPPGPQPLRAASA